MLIRWNPYREMIALNDMMNQLSDNSPASRTAWTESVRWNLPLDVIETNDAFIVKASVPGLNPADIEITFQDNLLTIQGEYKEEPDNDESQYHLRERRSGTFGRTITLSEHIQDDKIEAHYENGVLTLHLPKAEEIKPKRIQVQASKMLEGDLSQNKN